MILTLRKAVVEVLTLQLNGYVPGDMVARGGPAPDEPHWGETAQEEVDIVVAENGEARLVYPDADVEEMILWRFRRTAGKGKGEEEQVKAEAPQDTAVAVPATETAETSEASETADVTETTGAAETVGAREVDVDALKANREAWLADALANRGWVTLPLRSIDTKFAVRSPHPSGVSPTNTLLLDCEARPTAQRPNGPRSRRLAGHNRGRPSAAPDHA